MTRTFEGDWLVDRSRSGEVVLVRVVRRFQKRQTRFQLADVVETEAFGRALVLDGDLQSCSADEFIYHESLVHPAMLASPEPASVAILGGGEGATLREVLRHRAVERAVMIDIDSEVVGFCREHLTSFHEGAFDDARVELIFDDARTWIQRQPESSLDVVISDMAAPLEGGAACRLFTLEFYRMVQRALRPDGVLVAQAGQASALNHDLFAGVFRTIREVFDQTVPLTAFVDSFSDQWGFVLACQGRAGLPPMEQIDILVRDRVDGELRHVDGETLRHMTSRPLPLRRALEERREIFTDQNPPGVTFGHV